MEPMGGMLMERFGHYEEDGYKFEAFILRRPDTHYEYLIKVTKDDEEVHKERLRMESYSDSDTGETQWVMDPRDLTNIAKLEKRSSQILEDLKHGASLAE
jgi:hypothetical protein